MIDDTDQIIDEPMEDNEHIDVIEINMFKEKWRGKTRQKVDDRLEEIRLIRLLKEDPFYN